MGNQDEIEIVEQVTVPNIVGMTIKEAEKTVKELGLELNIENTVEGINKEETTIVSQTPTEGITVNKKSKIFISY